MKPRIPATVESPASQPGGARIFEALRAVTGSHSATARLLGIAPRDYRRLRAQDRDGGMIRERRWLMAMAGALWSAMQGELTAPPTDRFPDLVRWLEDQGVTRTTMDRCLGHGVRHKLVNRGTHVSVADVWILTALLAQKLDEPPAPASPSGPSPP